MSFDMVLFNYSRKAGGCRRKNIGKKTKRKERNAISSPTLHNVENTIVLRGS